MGGVKFHHLRQTQSLRHISMIPCHACCYRMGCLKIMYIRLKKSSVIYLYFYCLTKYHYIFHVQFETVGPSLADSFCVIASLPSANNIFNKYYYWFPFSVHNKASRATYVEYLSAVHGDVVISRSYSSSNSGSLEVPGCELLIFQITFKQRPSINQSKLYCLWETR